jgi:hypothetical protein
MNHLKRFVVGLLVIGMLITPMAAAAQQQKEEAPQAKSLLALPPPVQPPPGCPPTCYNGYQAAYNVTHPYHTTALNSVTVNRTITATQVSNATVTAQSFYAALNSEGNTALAQTYLTKGLQYGKPAVNTAALQTLWTTLVGLGMSSTMLTETAFVNGMTQLYNQASPQAVTNLIASNGLANDFSSLLANMNKTVTSIQTVKYSPAERDRLRVEMAACAEPFFPHPASDRQKGHYQKVEQFNCALMDAELGVVVAIVGAAGALGCVPCVPIAAIIALQVALMALICELETCPTCTGVNFDDCPECTAELYSKPSPIYQLPALRKEGV